MPRRSEEQRIGSVVIYFCIAVSAAISLYVTFIAAYEYCMEKKWLCGFGRVTDKGFHKVTANFYKDTTAA